METAQYYVVSIRDELYAVSEDEVIFYEKRGGELYELPNEPDEIDAIVWIEPLYFGYDECVRGKFLGTLEEHVEGAFFYVKNTHGLLLPRDGWALRQIAPGEYAVMSDESDD